MRRKFFKRALAALLALSLTAGVSAFGAQTDTYIDGYSTLLAAGATLKEGTYWTGSDYRSEHYIELSQNAAVRPVAASWDTLCANGSLNTLAMRLRERENLHVFAGVNGSFFSTGNYEPVGMVVQNGVLRAGDEGLNAVGFRTDGSAILGRPELCMTLRCGEVTETLGALNEGYYSGLVMYTADFFSGKVAEGCNVLCSIDGSIPISGSVELTVLEKTEEAVKIPEEQVLLHCDEETQFLAMLNAGDTLTLDISCAEGWESVDSAVGILFKLLTEGAVESGLETAAAPRTAIGIKADGSLILYTVDGRQSGYSVGMGMDKLAQRMKELGCVSAGALDGGGSTNLSAQYLGDDSLSQINRPSGGSARSVVNYIFLVQDQLPAARASQLALYPLHLNALVGAQQQLTVKAADSAAAAAAVPAGVSYSVSGGVGRVVDGVFYAECAGSGTITVSAPGLASASIPVKVVAQPDKIEVYGEKYGKLTTSLTLEPEQEVDLTARAEYNHVPLLSSDTCFQWTLEEAAGTVDETGHIVPASDSGSGLLTVSVGDVKTEVPITIRAALPFYDVKKSDSFYDAVKFVYDNEIFKGTGDTSFEPEVVMNRGMIVTVLWRLSGAQEAENLPAFLDVSMDDWYGPAVAWAAENGIVNGYSDVQFAPLDELTKEQILTIIHRWAGLPEAAENALLVATDAHTVDDWAREAMLWATEESRRLVDLDEDGNLLPRQSMTRAAVAEVLMRFLSE